MHTRRFTQLALVAVVALGCNKADPHSRPGSPSAGAQAKAPGQLSGKLLETLSAGGYTYLRLASPAGPIWASVPQAEVQVGDQLTVSGATEMKNFASKTLKRTFPSIYFGTLGAANHPGHGMMDPHAAGTMARGHMGAMPGHGSAKTAKLTLDPPVALAAGPNGRTVAQIYAERSALADKPVSVRGKVTKVNENIMGQNWLHLQDGSGDAARSDFDLTVTTKDKATVGEMVQVDGVVKANRNVGAGYSYQVLIENAKLKR